MFNPQRIVVPKQRHNIFELVTNIIKKKSELDGRCYFSGMTPTPEAEENLKPCLSADIQPKSHLPPGVWRQPKDTKDWGEEYVTKDHPDKLKEVGQGRHSSLENVLCETSLAGKSQGAM